jgi:hypothetical protein
MPPTSLDEATPDLSSATPFIIPSPSPERTPPKPRPAPYSSPGAASRPLTDVDSVDAEPLFSPDAPVSHRSSALDEAVRAIEDSYVSADGTSEEDWRPNHVKLLTTVREGNTPFSTPSLALEESFRASPPSSPSDAAPSQQPLAPGAQHAAAPTHAIAAPRRRLSLTLPPPSNTLLGDLAPAFVDSDEEDSDGIVRGEEPAEAVLDRKPAGLLQGQGIAINRVVALPGAAASAAPVTLSPSNPSRNILASFAAAAQLTTKIEKWKKKTKAARKRRLRLLSQKHDDRMSAELPHALQLSVAEEALPIVQRAARMYARQLGADNPVTQSAEGAVTKLRDITGIRLKEPTRIKTGL